MHDLELKPRKWYWMSSGMCGNDSTLVSPYRKTGNQDGGYYMLSAALNGGEAETMPMKDEWEAIGLDGRKVRISANQLKAAGRIGIGTIEERESPRLYVWKEDAARMIASGFSEDEICECFGTTWRDGSDDGIYGCGDLTDRMIEMLEAVASRKEEEEARKKKADDEEFVRSLQLCREKYGYIPCKKTDNTKYLTTGETSRNLRAILKHEFPGCRFSVRSSSYSGGDSVHVGWVDGPSLNAVRAVVDRFGSCTFDGMQDLEESFHTAFHAVAGDFSYTFCERNVDKDILGNLIALMKSKGFKDETSDSFRHTMWELLDRTDLSKGKIVDLTWIEELNGEYYGKYDPVFEKKDAGTEIIPSASVTGVVVSENREKGGIELRFSTKPSQSVLDDLKSHGWRWTRFGKCWYAKATDENREYARQLAG